MKITIHIDGASRGNPGPSACAFKISGFNIPSIKSERVFNLGVRTCNEAEYEALIHSLGFLLVNYDAFGFEPQNLDVEVFSDSLLLVNQFNHKWQVLRRHLRFLREKAESLASCFGSVQLAWIPREQNLADPLTEKILGPRN